MKAEMIHVVWDGVGIHIPKVFCEKYKDCIVCDDKLEEQMKEAVNTCLHEEDCDDAWEYIIENAVIVIEYGTQTARYRIYQDGDVWLIPCSKHVKWVPDEDCEVDDEDLDDDFCSYLDDVNPAVTLFGVKYAFSYVLFSVDECAYNQEYSNWLDSELTDKQLVEIDGKYYRVSAKEPEEYSGYWFAQDDHEGHYEWKDVPEIA
jgi:hypothetical protein